MVVHFVSLIIKMLYLFFYIFFFVESQALNEAESSASKKKKKITNGGKNNQNGGADSKPASLPDTSKECIFWRQINRFDLLVVQLIGRLLKYCS